PFVAISFSIRLEIKLYTQLREPGRDDRKRRQPGRAERLLIAVGDARVEDVVHVERDVQPSLLQPDRLCKADVELIEPFRIQRTRLNDVHSGDGRSAC